MKVMRKFFVISCISFTFFTSQAQDSTTKKKEDFKMGGTISVTNNGISLLPTFTLGKPAAIFDLSLAGKRFSFEPQFRFALEGKPWSMIFWWRYKVVNSSRFLLKVGAHPAIAFKRLASCSGMAA